MKASISLDKERIKLKGNGQKVIVPIHPCQGEPWIEPIDEEVDIWQLYQIKNNKDYTEVNTYGEIHIGNQDSVGYNSDAELYDWEVENYETQARGCWIIQAIHKKPTHRCFSVSIIPKIFEEKTREYPTLIATNTSIIQNPRYKERESLVLHIEQVSKNLGEHGRLQSLVETFTGQVAQWWDTHQSRMQTWTTTSTYFVKIFWGKKLTK